MGKAITQEEKRKMIAQLKVVFKLGCSIRKACDYTGLPYSTVATWISKDVGLRSKVKLWQNEPNMKARKNWVGSIKKKDFDASKDWLERKEKDEFTKAQGHVDMTMEDLKDVRSEIEDDLKDEDHIMDQKPKQLKDENKC